MATREARCSCGQLRVWAEGDPLRVSICHCLACQRRTGSVFGAQARFPVRIEGRHTDFVRVSDDGEGRATFSFCPECGATIVAGARRRSRRGVRLPVVPGAVVSVWEERRHAWVTVPEGAERHD